MFRTIKYAQEDSIKNIKEHNFSTKNYEIRENLFMRTRMAKRGLQTQEKPCDVIIQNLIETTVLLHKNTLKLEQYVILSQGSKDKII